jgi:hypothetical protein
VLVEQLKTIAMTNIIDISNIPDVRDGLTRKERIILYCLKKAQEEMGGRNVPTIMLYGRVVELVDISQEEFQMLLSRMTGIHGGHSRP